MLSLLKCSCWKEWKTRRTRTAFLVTAEAHRRIDSRRLAVAKEWRWVKHLRRRRTVTIRSSFSLMIV
jgi:hypothetical protein